MTNERKLRLHRVYSILLSISVAAAAICLAAACAGIYVSGQPFSRKAVAEAFSPIAIPVWLCLLLSLCGILLEILLPAKPKKNTVKKQDDLLLQRLHSKTDLDQCSPELRAAVKALQQERRRRRVLLTAVLILSALVFLAYLLSGDRFLLPDINSSMVSAMLVLLPCLAAVFGYAVYAAYRDASGIAAEIKLLKQADAKARVPGKPGAASSQRYLPILRCVLLLAGIVLVVFGFNIGGAADVLAKAINICTECVGLG